MIDPGPSLRVRAEAQTQCTCHQRNGPSRTTVHTKAALAPRARGMGAGMRVRLTQGYSGTLERVYAHKLMTKVQINPSGCSRMR